MMAFKGLPVAFSMALTNCAGVPPGKLRLKLVKVGELLVLDGVGWPKTGVRLMTSNPSAIYFEIFIRVVVFIQKHAGHGKILRQKYIYLAGAMISETSLVTFGGLAEISNAALSRAQAGFACDCALLAGFEFHISILLDGH